MRNIIIYCTLINLIAFFLYGFDKQKAKRHQWRIPEATLLGIAALGGSIGAFCGMYVFRHKTKKWKFVLGIPLVFLFQLILLVFVFAMVSGYGQEFHSFAQVQCRSL